MKIGNPRNIPKDIRILITADDREWFEGDTWIKPPEMSEEAEGALTEKGFLVVDDDG